MNFFIEQGENAINSKGIISGTDVCSEEEGKMTWMRETRIRISMQMELKACRDELDWLIIRHNCAADNCPEREYPPRPHPFSSDYIDNLQRRLGKVMKGMLPPTLRIILKTYYQAPVRPQQQEISSCSEEQHFNLTRCATR